MDAREEKKGFQTRRTACSRANQRSRSSCAHASQYRSYKVPLVSLKSNSSFGHSQLLAFAQKWCCCASVFRKMSTARLNIRRCATVRKLKRSCIKKLKKCINMFHSMQCAVINRVTRSNRGPARAGPYSRNKVPLVPL